MNSFYTVKQLVMDVQLVDVLERVEKYYGQQDSYCVQKITQLTTAYEQLRNLDAADNKDEMTLWIWAYVFDDKSSGSISPSCRVIDYQESEYESKQDIRQMFDVCAVDAYYDNDIRYSHSGLSQKGHDVYRRYLGLYIEDETLEGFSKESL